jgi:hypothetical protein
VKRLLEDLKNIPAKVFCNAKASRKRWLITQEDRDLYQKALTEKVTSDFEKMRESLKERYALCYAGKPTKRGS